MTRAARTFAVVLALALPGCAQNSILELSIDLPLSARLAATELTVLTGHDGDFDSARWSGAPTERVIEVARLERIDVVADGEAIEAPLGLRLRLCPTDDCPAGSPEVRIGIERAFYVGQRTSVHVFVPAVPEQSFPPLLIGRCEVAGCLGGDTGTYCRLDGTHYCE